MTKRHMSPIFIFLLMGFSSTNLQAQDKGGLYLKAFSGLSMLKDTNVDGSIDGKASFGSGPVAGAAIGYDYADSPLRSELEFAWRSGDASSFTSGPSGDFASTIFMLNGYYDFQTGTSFTPYVGVGAGYVTEIDFDISGGLGSGEYNDRGGFAWQAMGGVSYAINNRIGLSVELRYLNAGRRTMAGSSGSIRADYEATDAILGLRYRF